MKKLLTLILISVSIASFAQKKEFIASAKTINGGDPVVSTPIESLQRTILFSKGEAFTEKEWQDYRKQMLPLVMQYFKRDSAHNKFLGNTVSPHLVAGDTIENYSVTLEGVFIKLKTKKK